MERTLSFKVDAQTVEWVDSHPGGRSTFLRELVEQARLAELAARDATIIQSLGGNVSDIEPVVDLDEWAAAAAEWDGIDL